MKIVKYCFCCAVLSAMVAGQATATTFFADHFNYADGQLTDSEAGAGDNVSGGLWVGHSGTTFNDNVDVIGGQAELLNSGSEDVNRSAGAAMAPGDKWYYGAMITINDTRADSVNDPLNEDYFMHFKDGGFGFRGRTTLLNPTVSDPNKFTLAVAATSSSGGISPNWGTDLSFGQQYKIIVSYALDTGEVELWVDPVDENSTKVTHTASAGAFTQIDSLGMRQDYTGGDPNNQILVGAVALGDNFNDVMRDVMIPEPSSLLLTFAALVGIATMGRSRKS
ncbi:MAG: PEP-CTERM sorting domain-containing protein [Pirellulales bacterium]